MKLYLAYPSPRPALTARRAHVLQPSEEIGSWRRKRNLRDDATDGCDSQCAGDDKPMLTQLSKKPAKYRAVLRCTHVLNSLPDLNVLYTCSAFYGT